MEKPHGIIKSCPAYPLVFIAIAASEVPNTQIQRRVILGLLISEMLQLCSQGFVSSAMLWTGSENCR